MRATPWVDGASVRHEPERVRRQLGALPHNAGVYQRLTAVENIRYYGQLQGLEGAMLETRIATLIEQLDMGAFAERRTKGFSQGQRMKVALARALIHEPGNLLLDEPTNGLDVMATRALRDLVAQLRDAGACILLSSHVMQEIANLADRLVIIAGGTVRFDGTKAALQEHAGCDDLEDAFVRIAVPDEEPAR